MTTGKTKRGVKTRCGNTWTESKYFSFIRSALRMAWTKYPVKYKCMNNAKRKYEGLDKRRKWEYNCNICNSWFKGTEVQIDHIVECGSLKTYEDLPRFVSTLFCELDNLQLLCKKCHKEKI